MAKALEDYNETLNEYKSNLENMREWSANQATSIFRTWQAEHLEQFQKGLELAQAVGASGSAFSAIKKVGKKILGTGDTEDEEAEQTSKDELENADDEYDGGALREEGFTEQDAEGLFQSEEQPVASSRAVYDGPKGNSDPIDSEFGTDDLIGQEVDNPTFNISSSVDEAVSSIGDTASAVQSGVSEATQSALQGATDLAEQGSSIASEAVSGALDTASAALGYASDVVGPVADIASIGLLISSLIEGAKDEAPPVPQIQWDTPSAKNLTVSGSYSSTMAPPPSAIF